MKRSIDLELTVGFFVLIGILCLGYLTIKVGKMEIMGGSGYEIKAVFSNVGGLSTGSDVTIAGVRVGSVSRIELLDYNARVTMRIFEGVKIQEDAIASVKTKGLIGEKYIEISPGGSDTALLPGETLRDTQPSVDIEELISKYVFGKM
ncbi:MAG: outer membrane lipid asymmetry maintenance protein MlaD [Desulfatiglandales bacterium]